MDDFAIARRQMVDCQIRPNDITNHNIIDAFGDVPREMFVPHTRKSIAYADSNIMLETVSSETGQRYLMQATPFAKMVQASEIKKTDLVLCIGCGSGYGAAIIAQLADSVVAIDCEDDLVERASEVLTSMSIDNLAVVKAELKAGYPGEAPFDLIFIEGALEAVPDELFAQLNDGGRLVVVVGQGLSSEISVFIKNAEDVSLRRYGNAAVPVLPGFEKEREFVF